MNYLMCCGVAVLALSVSTSAQDHSMDHMKSEMTYTGCLERSSEGAITLAHAMAPKGAAKKTMSKDAMAHDSMMKDAMEPALTLSSTSVDLAKHLGHKVTVKGTTGDMMGGTTTFTVTSMKMVATKCS